VYRFQHLVVRDGIDPGAGSHIGDVVVALFDGLSDSGKLIASVGGDAFDFLFELEVVVESL